MHDHRWTFTRQPVTSALGRDVGYTHVFTLAADGGPRRHRVVPDGCVDVVWGPGSALRVAGPDTAARMLTMPAATKVLGVRFRPGHASPLLGVPASALADTRVELTELWGADARRLADRLDEAPSDGAAIRIVLRTLAGRMATAPAPDPLVDAAMAGLQRSAQVGVATLSANLGVSERQLRRRFTEAVGYGPKRFQQIMRLNRFFAVGCRQPPPTVPLGRIALDLGYADQSHFSRECTALTGVTPKALLGRDPYDGDL